MQRRISWEGAKNVEILCFETLASTQLYLTQEIREGRLCAPVAVIARMQTGGIGSRNNRWEGSEGNFFASVALAQEALPDDLPIASASIYFAWLMRELLAQEDPEIWLKWPNDLYLREGKIGGVVTQRIKKTLVAGIGVNLKKKENFFDALETELSPMILLDMYLKRLENPPSWKSLFSKYRIEFEKSRRFGVHAGTEYKSLENARLMEDGSLMIGNERITGNR